ncbi:MAG: hypothetical protein RL226_1645 [Bacteroidota bacterium]
MDKLTVLSEGNTFKVSLGENVFSEIKFRNITDADIHIGNKVFEAIQTENKDIVLNENGKALLTFKFDKLWGGAEIINMENNSEFEIKGRWFKIGTRLTDDTGNDLVVVLDNKNDFEVNVSAGDIDPLMILSTVYYHIYATRGKLLSLVV